jgi:hypothetical protein
MVPGPICPTLSAEELLQTFMIPYKKGSKVLRKLITLISLLIPQPISHADRKSHFDHLLFM